MQENDELRVGDVIEAINNPGFKVKVINCDPSGIEGELLNPPAKISIKASDLDLWSIIERAPIHPVEEKPKEKTPEEIEAEIKEQKRRTARHNVDLLIKYINTMEKDLVSAINEATNGVTNIEFGNPAGFQPYCSGGSCEYLADDYAYLPAIYFNFKKDKSDEEIERINDYGVSDLDCCRNELTYMPYPYISEIGFDYTCTGMTEADDFHSGTRNIEAWTRYIIKGEAEFKDLDDIHDQLDCDAELFACVKWKYFECLSIFLVAACIEMTNNLKDAMELFFNTNYAKESGFPDIGRNFWMFKDAASPFCNEDDLNKLEKELKKENN